MTVIKDTKYKKALLVELCEVYISKGLSIHDLVGRDIDDFNRPDLEDKLRNEGIDTGIIKQNKG